MTGREFHDEVWWPRCERRLRKVTRSSYEAHWRNHIEPLIGRMDLGDISPRFLDSWLLEEDVSHGTWRVMKLFVKLAYRYEVIERDPCDKVLNAPRKPRPRTRTLRYPEMVEMMDGLAGYVVYPTICCSCYLGLRREESCGLLWEDFDWDEGIVHIGRGLQYVDGEEVWVDPKTPLSDRRLPIPPELRERIYPLRSSGRLCGPLTAHQIADRYRDYCRSHGLPYVPMSSLRTSWATYMANRGVPVSLISRWMGHADVETTERWYIKPREEDLAPLALLWAD